MNRFYKIYLPILVALFLVASPCDCSEAPKVIQDRAGRIIEIPKPFTRIISLYGAHTHNLRDMGLDREIIGVCPSDKWSGKETFSYHDGLEKFLAARPDLVLVRPMIDRGYAPLMEGLERAGITVVSLQPSNVEEMFGYWISLGVLTGKMSKAQGMVLEFQEQVKYYQSLTKDLPHKKNVYFEAIHSRMKTFSSNSMAIFALETAGGLNVARDAQSVRDTNIAHYGKERILSKALEIDVFLSQKGAMNQPTLSMIRDEPGFEVIKAVREGQVHIVDEKIVSRPTMDLLKGVQGIGKILYPQIFTDGGQS